MSSTVSSPGYLGRQRFHVVQDCMYLYPHGEPSLEEVIAIHSRIEILLARYGWAFMIIDGSRGFRISSEARRWISQWHTRQPSTRGGSVTYGAGLVTRTFMTILLGAINALSRREFAIGFAADESGAHAWIKQQRQVQDIPLRPTSTSG